MSLRVVSNVDGAILGATASAKALLITTAIRVTAQAKALAPVDTGQLRGSLMWIVGDEESSFTGPRIIKTTINRFNRITGYVGTAVEHGIYQEFGTRLSPASPYMRPAILIVTKGASYESIIGNLATVEMSKNIKKKQREYNV